MPRLLNNQTKMVENIPDEAVSQAIASGAYSARRGALLPVISSTGDIGTIDAAEAQIAFQQGFQYQSKEQAKQTTDEQIKSIWREEMDMPGTAFAAGVLRGPTFGLSDVAMRGIGALAGRGEDVAKGLQQVKEVSPLASVAGEIVGTVAAIPTAAGVGVKAASKLGTAITEGTIGKLTAKYGADSVITKAAQLGAGTALGTGVEGALYGAGTVISEAALGDPQLSAQQALMTIGLGGVIGGAFGGLTKGGSEVYSKFKDVLQKSSLPTAAADVIAKGYSFGTGLTRGLDPEVAERMKGVLTTRQGRDAVSIATRDRTVNESTMLNSLADINKTGQAYESAAKQSRSAFTKDLDIRLDPMEFAPKKTISADITPAALFGKSKVVSDEEAINKLQRDILPLLNREEKASFNDEIKALFATTPELAKVKQYISNKTSLTDKQKTFYLNRLEEAQSVKELRGQLAEENAIQYAKTVPTEVKPIGKEDLLKTQEEEIRAIRGFTDDQAINEAKLLEASINKENQSLQKGTLRYNLMKDIDSSFKNTFKTMTEDKELYNNKTIAVIKKRQEQLYKNLAKAQTAGDFHSAVENTRILIDREANFSKLMQGPREIDTIAAVRGLREKLNQHLTNAEFYSKEFTDVYSDLNRSWNNYLTVKDNMYKMFGTEGRNEFGLPERTIDPGKISTYFRNPETNKNLLKDLELNKYVEAIKGLDSTAAKTNKLDPDFSKLLLGEVDSAKNTFDKISDARAIELFINNLEVRTGKAGVGTLLGGTLGGIVGGGLPGALVGGAIGTAFATPRSFLNILLAIENHGIAGQQRIQSAVGNFYGSKLAGATNAVTRGVAPIVKPVTIKAAIEFLGGEGDSIEDLKTTIESHGNDPQKLWKTLEDNNPYLDEVAPEYSKEMINTMNRGVQFLQQKMPQNYTQDMFGTKPAPVSDSQKRSIAAYTDAIFRPSRIFEELEKSQPDPKVIEAVQAVYPALYAKLQEEVMKQAVDSNVTYQKKLVLGKLFALPTTASLERINDFQKSYIRPPQKPQSRKPVKFESINRTQTTGDSLQD